jgi:hypothetical protein
MSMSSSPDRCGGVDRRRGIGFDVAEALNTVQARRQQKEGAVETKELIAGYWVIEVTSKEEAIE